jgi:AcrR family transcriptional regulator
MKQTKQRAKPTKPEPVPDATRERILSVARSLFESQGFAKTSTRAIAAKAECNISLIAYYFGGKEGLLEAVAKHVAQGVGEKLKSLETEGLTPEKAIQQIVPFMITYISQNRGVFNLIFRAYIAENKPLPPLLSAQIAENAGALIALLEKLQHKKHMRPDIDPRIAATLLMGMTAFQFLAAPIVSKVVNTNSSTYAARLQKSIEAIFLHGIGERHS